MTAIIHANCPRCGDLPGPRRRSNCPGCWDTCKAKFGPKEKEPNPCGQPATHPFHGPTGQVLMCKSHADRFNQAVQQQAEAVMRNALPMVKSLIEKLRKDGDL